MILKINSMRKLSFLREMLTKKIVTLYLEHLREFFIEKS